MNQRHQQRSEGGSGDHTVLDVIDSLEQLDEEYAPITRLPHFDVFDHGSDLPLREPMNSACKFPLQWDSRPSDIGGQPDQLLVALSYLRRFAYFISNLIDQETVSVWCNLRTGLREWNGTVVAERPLDGGNECRLRAGKPSTGSSTATFNVTDYSYHFSSIEKRTQVSSERLFSLVVGCEGCHVKVAREGTPKAAIKGFLDQLQDDITGIGRSKNSFPDEHLSILNQYATTHKLESGSAASRSLLHELFEARAAQAPDHCAIEYLHPKKPRDSPDRLETWSYERLNAKCDSVAKELQATIHSRLPRHSQHGIVAVFLSTSPELFISYLAILKAGYAFCPLPTDVPVQRFRDILGEVQPLVVLGAGPVPVDGLWAEASGAFNIQWLDVRGCPARQEKPVASHSIPDSLAYLIHTSGSTGGPKGVQITHRAAAASILAHIVKYWETMPEDVPMRWYQFAAPTFDPSIMEIFVTLCSGGTLCSAPREMTLSSPEVAITETRSTIMMATPGFASMLDVDRMPTLTYLWTMGETLNSKVLGRFAHPDGLPSKAIPGSGTFSRTLHLCNAYGPTEAAINVTFFPNVPPNARGSIIGRPLGTSSVLVIDPRCSGVRPVPTGFVGELVIGGEQLSIGYLQRSNKNLTAFVTDERYGRLYRTGDRAKVVWDTKGVPMLEYLGRLSDDQVKVNGQRVELGEIENALCTVPDIRSVVVIRDPNKKTGAPLVACLLLDPKAEISFEAIKERCRESMAARLPFYMHPRQYLHVDDLPRTAAGKVDRKAMAIIVSKQRHSGLEPSSIRKEDSSISTGLNQQAAHLLPRLEDALQKTIGPSIPAAEELKYWLDSLSALRFLRNIKCQGIENLSLKDILHANSVVDLARVASDQSREQRIGLRWESPKIAASVKAELDGFHTRWRSLVPQNLDVAVEDVLHVLPATTSQERILLSFSKSRHKPTRQRNYVHHSIHRFVPGTGINKLKTTWRNVLDRHDVYRTVFMPVDDGLSSFAQVILSPNCHSAQVRWAEKTDAENMHNPDVLRAASKAESLISLESATPVLTILKTPTSLSVMLSMLHAIFDLSSLHLLLEEVAAEMQGRAPPLRTSLRVALATCYDWQGKESDDFWDKYMNGYEILNFPSLTGVRAELTLGSTASAQVTSNLTLQRLEKRSRALLCSPLSALQAAWSTILDAYTSSTSCDVAFGTLFAGRSDRGRELCMAPTFSIVPTRTRFEPLSTNIDILRALTYANSDAMHYLRPSPRRKGTYILQYDTTVAFQATHGFDAASDLPQDTVILPMAHDYAVMIETIPDAQGRIFLQATYSDAYMDHESARLMLSQLDDIMVWILANPMLPFRRSLGCLGGTQLSILNPNPGFLSTGGIPPETDLLHTQFEMNVRKHAGRTALEYHYSLQDNPGSLRSWSYGELNDRAQKLATRIRTRFGNVTGTVIPILMEKQPELYIAVLAILKAGAAWSPIDTSSPAKRRLELIARLDAKLILVSEDMKVVKEGLPSGVQVMAVPIGGEVEESQNPSEPSHDQRPTCDSLGYLIWTSGTTGAPKGVRISHRAASISMKAIQAAIPWKTEFGGAPRCLQFSQHTFDVFVQDLFYTWGVGGTVLSASKELMTNSFAKLSRTSQASHAFLTPAFAASVRRESCPTLEVITMIGEKLPQHVADDWGHDIKAFNTYGPAEATVVSTLTEFSGSGRSVRSSNIGRPLPSVSCHVLREGKEVMIQGVGELALGGPQLAEGYLNDSAITRAKFIRRINPEQVLYLTGDVVRQLANGSLEFIGREDDLVKLGGIRVELSEISYALKGCNELVHQIETCYIARSDRSEAVVSFIAANIAQPDSDQHQSICTPESAEIAGHAMKQAKLNLPRYMIPSIIVVLQEIPKTSSAKVDRKALKKAYEDLDLGSWETAVNARQLGVFDDQALSGNELKLRQCLSDFCDVRCETIGLHSSLNSLGIDSLSAARFVHRLTKFEITVQITDVLQSQTVHDLLQFVGQQHQKDSIPDKCSHAAKRFSEAWLRHVQSCLGRKASFIMPATPLQEGVLSETMLNQSSYWSNHCFELRPDVEIDRLHSAWALVSRNTQALRTTFVTLAEVDKTETLPPCPSSFLQIVGDEIHIDWAELDMDISLQDTAQRRADGIFSYHQSNAFRHPAWAVTIVRAESHKYMILTIHHSVHDAESISFIMSDLASAYAVSTIRHRHQITEALPPNIEYDWRPAGEEYWRSTLLPYADTGVCTWPDLVKKDCTASKTVPRSMISERYELRLSSEEISRTTRAIGARFSVVLKVAFGCLLLNYLETPAIVFAEIVSQRVLNPHYRDAIAPLVATMPVPFTARQTARELLSEQDRLAADLWAHGSPSGPFVRKLLRRSPREPLYPAFFVFHARHQASGGKSGSQAAPWSQDEELLGLSTEHDLSLNVYHGDRCTFELVASDRIMDNDSLRTFCMQMESLVQAILRSPDRPRLGLLDDADANVISLSKSRWPKPADHPCNMNPTYWVEHYAQYHADWTAIEVATVIQSKRTETRTWSFERLLSESRSIANFIKGRGCCGRIIAMCTGRTLQSYAIILGTLMSGNTYLPIDDGLPQQRKLLLLEDSDCALLFTDDSCIGVFGSSRMTCAIINIDDAAVAREIQQTTDGACARPNPSESAYLLYTSGSTGKPKGVLISHTSLCGFIEGLTNYMGHCSALAQSKAGTGKWLGLASRAFDVHLAEMFLAWRSGLTAVTAPREVLLDDLQLALTNLHVTHAICVPSLLEQADLTPEQLPDLVFMTIGGEKISKRIVDVWAGHPRVTAVNAYGPTELAIGCSASHIVPNFDVSDIGFPYGDTTAHILVPETNHYTTKGQTGELCFTGCLVGNGYLNRPDAKGFVSFRGQRMYRTGDLARMSPNGSLVFLGRRDDQTKLRGQRVELSEISESIRTAFRGAIEVITLLLEHSVLPGTFLTCFVSDLVQRAQRYDATLALVDERFGAFTTSVRDHCRRALPTYMVPDHILPINVVPLAPVSGKANVKLLKSFFSSLPAHILLGTAGKEPHEEIHRSLSIPEHRVATVVKDVLRLGDQNSIRAKTNLFGLGLDSLNAIGLMVKLREVGLQCSLVMLLSNPTVESIASLGDWSASLTLKYPLQTDGNEFHDLLNQVIRQDDLRVPANTVEKVLPCLPVQESTVTATLNSGGSIAYINHIVFKLRHNIDISRFRKAWFKLIESTPILRTVFYHHQDSFVQVVLESQSIPSPWMDLTADREESARSLLSDSAQVFNHDISTCMEKQPPLRLRFVRTSHGHHIFCVAIHHALYDGQSFELMMEDLWLLYQKKNLPPRTTFDALLGFYAAQDRLLQERFWNRYLAKCHSMHRVKANTVRDETSASIYHPLQLTLSELQDVANRLEVTTATLSQCVFAIALARRTQTSDILYGSILSGRSIPIEGAESIRAPCISTIPRRLQFQSDEPVSRVIGRIQSSSTECLEHQHTSLRDISRWTKMEQPMFDALFSFTWNKYQDQDVWPWVQVESSMVLGYPLAVEFAANKTSNILAVTCEYTRESGAEQEVARFVDEIEILMTMLANGEDPSVSSMGIVESISAPNSAPKPWHETNWSAEDITIRDVIRDLTGLRTFDITKNVSFFHLGIDSVSAIRLAKGLRQNGLGVTSSDVMSYPCIGSLGHHLAEQLKGTAPHAQSAPPPVQANVWELVKDELKIPVETLESVYYCTPLQAGMITATLASHGEEYVHQHDHVLPDDVKTDRFWEAWAMTVQSVDILRTSFHYTHAKGAQWIACVHRTISTDHFAPRELSHLDSASTRLRFSEEDGFSEPPFLATLSQIDERTIFRLVLHHALYDGISLPMIFERLTHAYRSTSPDFAQVPSFYRAAHLISRESSQLTTFWLDSLKEYRNTTVHVSSDVPPHQIFLTKKCSITLETAIESCKSLGVTLQIVLLTAFSKVLATAVGRRDIAFGHVVAGRSLPLENCESIVGPLFNTVPFRVRLDNLLAPNIEVMNHIQSFTAKTQAHQHVSLAQVQREWRKKEGYGQVRLFDSIFLFQKVTSTAQNCFLGPAEERPLLAASEYCLNLEVEQSQTELTLSASGHEACLVDRPLDTFLDMFENVLQNLLANSAQAFGSHPSGFAALPLIKPEIGSTRPPHASETLNYNPKLQKIKAVLAKVSNIPIEEIPNTVSIFALGLTSLSAMAVAAECRRQGLDLSVADVLQGATVDGICSRLTKKLVHKDRGKEASTQIRFSDLINPPVAEESIEYILPALSGQTYHLSRWCQSSRTMYMPTWPYTCLKLDVSRIRLAWDLLRRRHPILRTTFAALSSTAIAQVVLKPSTPYEDLSCSVSETLDLPTIQQHIREEQRRETDIKTPPVRLRLIQGSTYDVMLLTIHHALYDAFSLPLIISDFAKLYRDEVVDVPPQWQDFVGQTTQHLQSSAKPSFWQQALHGFDRTIIEPTCPNRCSSPPNQAFISLPSTLTEVPTLSLRSSTYKVPLTTVLLLSFARSLSALTGTNNPIFGTFTLGRSASSFSGLSQLAGPCLNVLPLVVRSPWEEPWYLKAQDIQMQLAARISHEQDALPDVLEWVGGWMGESGVMPFNAFVNILWHESDEQQKVQASEGEGADNMFQVMDVGVPSDFVPKRGSERTETGLEGLRWPKVADGVYVDIALSRDGKSVDVGARVEGEAIGQEEARKWLSGIGERVNDMLKEA